MAVAAVVLTSHRVPPVLAPSRCSSSLDDDNPLHPSVQPGHRPQHRNSLAEVVRCLNFLLVSNFKHSSLLMLYRLPWYGAAVEVGLVCHAELVREASGNW